MIDNNMDDKDARLAALKGDRSFIVRAPAGSGKTELLIQRFLVLLASVDSPEQIVAITFTRKAAAEMRERIIKQLTRSLTDLPLDAPPHQQLTWRLARAALLQDQQRGWQLLAQPQRLRLMTIDALCADIVRQLPIASGLMHVCVSDQSGELYEAAVRELFHDLDDETPWQEALKTLLRHCDNRLEHLSALCQQLLREREQWLPLMHASQEQPTQLRRLLEANFQAIVLADMAVLDRLLTPAIKAALLPCLRLAAELCLKNQARYQVFRDCWQWPEASLANQTFWQALGQFLLTSDGQLRQRLDINLGFPPAAKAPDNATKLHWQAHKASMSEILLALRDDNAVVPALQNLAIAPPPVFADDEWPLCQAIFALLPPLLAYWQMSCEQRQQVDFAEVSWRARQALGHADDPSELALQLDYQVCHWLIDEFQDTSVAQFELFNALTAGWQAGDGRTLFIVGDPLQSIYRFRQAEVSLFWQVWHLGLHALPITPLALTRNFRSHPALITWFNESLQPLFPESANWQIGAVPYTPLIAARVEEAQHAAVIEYASANDDDETAETEAIIALLQTELQQQPQQSLAILVRARGHLLTLLPALKHHGIAYRAVELAPLSNEPVIRDLLCVVRVLLCADDRLAWAALLRAPWGGALALPDWQHVVGDSQRTFLWPFDETHVSAAGLLSLARIQPILTQALLQRHRQALSALVGQTWQALGAQHYWATATATAACEKIYELLRQEEQAGDIVDIARFERLLARTYLDERESATDGARVDIMTIHKAKGLEFDTVILPGQSRRQASDDTPLFVFDSLCGEAGARWLLAPMKAADVQQEPRYDFLRHLQKQKRLHEQQRLFYVACTRARERLYIFK